MNSRGFGSIAAAVAALWGLAASSGADAQSNNQAEPALAPSDPCAALASVRLEHASILSITPVQAGTLPACRVSVASHPTSDSDIRIEVWIPQGAGWNEKFVQVGNGGYAGEIHSDSLKAVAARGYVAAGTDDGHQAPTVETGWALGHPQKFIDFGWRSLKETTEVAKALIRVSKGRASTKSYFIGCSDGGREALMEVQRFPLDFDGVVAGAPGNYMARLMTMRAGYYQILKQPGGFLETPKLQIIENAALADCGGAKTGYILDPERCRFDPAKLLCKEGRQSDCLTKPELASIKAIYGGWRDPGSGVLRFPGFEPGAETLPVWRATILGREPEDIDHTAIGYLFAIGYLRNFAFSDPKFDLMSLDMGQQALDGVNRTAPVIDAENTDLSQFRAHGGKLIQYHGWNDQNIPPRSSLTYFGLVQKKMGDTSDFYRLFMVPGMLHCTGGRGPNSVDWLGQLDSWVLQGKAPEAIVARGASPAGTASTTAPQSQVLCRYPEVAQALPGVPQEGSAAQCIIRR